MALPMFLHSRVASSSSDRVSGRRSGRGSGRGRVWLHVCHLPVRTRAGRRPRLGPRPACRPCAPAQSPGRHGAHDVEVPRPRAATCSPPMTSSEWGLRAQASGRPAERGLRRASRRSSRHSFGRLACVGSPAGSARRRRADHTRAGTRVADPWAKYRPRARAGRTVPGEGADSRSRT